MFQNAMLMPVRFVALLAVLPQARAADPAVPNGCFEEEAPLAPGLPAAWEASGQGGQAVLDESDRAEGRCSLRLECPAGGELQARSAALSLLPLRRYRLGLWVKRTQGHDLSFLLEEHGEAVDARRHDLQLHWPGRFQPNWFPPAPSWTPYQAYFATGRDGRSWRLLIRQRCRDDRLGRVCRVDGLSLKEVGPVLFASEAQRGRNLLAKSAAEFEPDASGLPLAWSFWWGNAARVQTLREGGPDGGPFLRVKPDAAGGGGLCLAGGFFPVKEGYLYRFRVRARGRGSVTLAIHPLASAPGDPRAETALRIGNSHPRSFEVFGPDWQPLEGEWIAEIPGVRWFNPYLPISGEVDLGAASLEMAAP